MKVNSIKEEHFDTELNYNDEEDFDVKIIYVTNFLNKYIRINNYIGERKDVIIPPFIQNLSVYEIGDRAFGMLFSLINKFSLI